MLKTRVNWGGGGWLPCKNKNHKLLSSTQLTLSLEDPAELFVSMFHSFEAGIADGISSFIWQKVCFFMNNKHVTYWITRSQFILSNSEAFKMVWKMFEKLYIHRFSMVKKIESSGRCSSSLCTDIKPFKDKIVYARQTQSDREEICILCTFITHDQKKIQLIFSIIQYTFKIYITLY